jgi:ribosome recycling factor
LYDSIAYDEKVLPEIKQVMAQRQAAKDAEDQVNVLESKINEMEDASISLIDMLLKNK